jgi:hypothetical protein
MNCDQAFDDMTRADGVRSAELEQHLAGCRRCREMFEILSPALTGLQTESQSLAGTVEGLALKPRAIRVVAATRDEVGPAPRFLIRAQQGRQLWLKAFAFCCAGAVVVLGALLLRHPAERAVIPLDGSARDQCNLIHPELSKGDSPRSVTLTCVACHMPQQPFAQ